MRSIESFYVIWLMQLRVRKHLLSSLLTYPHRLLLPIGHFIQHCPTNGDPTYDMRKMKPPVGIPKTRLKADQEGSYILPDGSVAVMQPDE